MVACHAQKKKNERVGDSRHFAQAFRELSDIDWGMLKMKFDNKFLVNQWVEDTLSGVKIKSFEKLVSEGVLRGGRQHKHIV